ncbi:MAG: DUF4147 domain-containing protein, partial [Deltaproteobacteria bacterium]|nr:DUF4147 domain-containing protein [Deltaproteobacteria bacterium]
MVTDRLRRQADRLTIDLGTSRLVRPAASIWVAGAGKAAVAMARAVSGVIPEAEGVVVAPLASDRPLRIGRIEAVRGSHPVPDEASYRAAAKLLRRLAERPARDTVLLLLSGGASALLASPPAGVRRTDKGALARVLLRCGADIELMNTVRKHVSRVKGGGLLRLAHPRLVVTLALSDVVGDSLSTIGSGPGLPDPTTYTEALAGLERLGAVGALPPRVRRRLEAGRAGRPSAPETLKPSAPEARRAQGAVIGSNRTAIRAAA